MRYSKILFSTSKESVSSIDIASQELLVRAGYVRQLAAGIFSALHFGHRSFQKIEKILREEMEAIGGVEMSMPIVHPASIWKATGRYEDIDFSTRYQIYRRHRCVFYGPKWSSTTDYYGVLWYWGGAFVRLLGGRIP